MRIAIYVEVVSQIILRSCCVLNQTYRHARPYLYKKEGAPKRKKTNSQRVMLRKPRNSKLSI